MLAAPLGTVAFYWYLYFLTGDAFAQANSAAHGWGRTLDPTFPLLFELAFAGHQPIMLWALGSLAAAIALTVLLFRPGFVAEGAMVLCTVVFFAMANLPQSMLRYLTPLFPLYIALAVTLVRKPVLLWPTMIALAGLNVFMTSRWSLSSVLAS